MIELARELYDRFVMGGWEPQDAYAWIEERLAAERDEFKEAAYRLENTIRLLRTEYAALTRERDALKR